MKIGITGAQSVGKTTLLNALRSEPFFKDYTICNEVTRKVKAMGYPINQDGNKLTQRAIVLEHFYNLLMHDNMITDRTLIDSYVYTESLFRRTLKVSNTNNGSDTVTSETLNMSFLAMFRNHQMYDHIFFIEPEFNIEDDGVRSVDIEWRDEINSIFIETFDLFQIPYTKVSGSVANRVRQILETVGANNEQ